MNVLVVDDEKLVSSLISNFLNEIKIIDKIFWNNDDVDLVNQIKENEIKIVFLDLYLPKLTGFDILLKIKNEVENVKVIILSSHFERSYVERALTNGADGFLSKNIVPDELKSSIEYALNDKVYLCADCKDYKVLEDDDEIINPIELKESISGRELEVLLLISEGLNSGEIADKLYVSKNTIDFHKKSLFKKFGTNKSTKLVKTALLYNII